MGFFKPYLGSINTNGKLDKEEGGPLVLCRILLLSLIAVADTIDGVCGCIPPVSK